MAKRVNKDFQISHYSGCGNDFILLDNRKHILPSLAREDIISLCSERGARVDGMIIVEPSDIADVSMRFYNCDGNEAEMCGNGVRCLFKYLLEKLHWPKDFCKLQAKERTLHLSSSGNTIIAQMGSVDVYGWDIPLYFNEMQWKVQYLNTGVPHVVIFVKDPSKIEVHEFGSYVRHHELFSPKGTNVNFVQIPQDTSSTIALRTFERGVEQETLACGTGACAAACALAKIYNINSPITLQVKSGEFLTVFFDVNGSNFANLRLQGPACWIRDGKLTYDDTHHRYSLTMV